MIKNTVSTGNDTFAKIFKNDGTEIMKDGKGLFASVPATAIHDFRFISPNPDRSDASGKVTQSNFTKLMTENALVKVITSNPKFLDDMTLDIQSAGICHLVITVKQLRHLVNVVYPAIKSLDYDYSGQLPKSEEPKQRVKADWADSLTDF